MKLQYRPDIDGMRAIAIMSVVIFHVDPKLLPGGFLGVDIFFVISGYLISLLLFREQSQGTFSFSNFYIRRICRLFPALITVLVATLIFGYFALFADEYEQLGLHSSYAIVFLINFCLMGETGYFDLVSDAKPLLHLWSLSIEEQFYLFWPLALLFFRRLYSKTGLLIAGFLIVSYLYAISLSGHNPDSLYYHPLSRFWQLLMGAVLASYHFIHGDGKLPEFIDKHGLRGMLSVLGGAFTIGPLFVFDKYTPHPSAATFLPLLGVVMVIASANGVVNRILALKPLVFIGLISYPLYLWHWPLLSYTRIMESGSPDYWILWGCVVLAVLLAWLTWRFVEKPLRSKAKSSRVYLLVSSMLILMMGSVLIYQENGFEDRASLSYAKKAMLQMKREPKTNQACIDLIGHERAPRYCRLEGNEKNEWIAVIGDSHADALFRGVAEEAEKIGFGALLLANSGCPPLLGTVAGQEPKRSKCADEINKVIQSVGSQKKIKRVIIATRGPSYITGRGFGPAEVNNNAEPIAYDSSALKESSRPIDVFLRGLEVTVQYLVDADKSVYYFLQVPELGVPAKNCLGRPLRLTKTTDCVISLYEFRERMEEYRQNIKALTTKLSTLKLIDPLPLFCDELVCRGIINDTLFYADDDHLSVNGSRYVASLVLKVLSENNES